MSPSPVWQYFRVQSIASGDSTDPNANPVVDQVVCLQPECGTVYSRRKKDKSTGNLIRHLRVEHGIQIPSSAHADSQTPITPPSVNQFSGVTGLKRPLPTSVPALNVLMVGTGEYTTGFVGGAPSGSDKKVGVVGLCLFDLRRRGKVGNLSMVGTSGNKFPAIRQHLNKHIRQVYNNLDTSFTSFPADTKRDPEAYKVAIDALSPGDAITIFTPDSTHHSIALYAIRRGIHVMITKPATKLLSEHLELLREAHEHKVLVYVEHHKRFDPAYADARHRALNTALLGDFNYFYSYMSQPKSQLETFKVWAGKESDISYYLNSHHVDVCESMVGRDWRPVTVMASGTKGIANSLGCDPNTEDLITLLVDWVKKEDDGKRATSVFTASWTAPLKAGVHSAQRFHYVASKGAIEIDQSKRGYETTYDDAGVAWTNPFYMKYAPDEKGDFAGQTGYGYVSFEKFADAIQEIKDGEVTLEQIDARGLPTIQNTVTTTAILEAGRRSLDEHRIVEIVRDASKGAEGWSLL